MSNTKFKRRARRHRGNSARSSAPGPGDAGRSNDSLAPRDGPDTRSLLDRILNTAHLAHVVPRLQPEVLHRVIERCGLEDCAEIVALATPDQLARVFDLDLWRAPQPGMDEQFDADRFGMWLEVLMQSGAGVAAQTLVEMDEDLVVAALAQHARVFDLATVSPAEPMDGGESAAPRRLKDGLSFEVGGYLVAATRADSWDAIVALLIRLDAEHRDYFHRVMRGCRSLSNSSPEVDGLDDLLTARKQVTFDLAFDRERRREKQGYVTPAQASAFLQMSRQLRLGHDATPPANPVARAYFRAVESATAADGNSPSRQLPPAPGAPPSPEDSAAAVAAVVGVLLDAGVIAPQPRALLTGPQGGATRLARIHAHMQFAADRDQAAYSMRTEEFAYLANAILAGCSIQARPFTAKEASDAAVAVCNLGLENWPAGTELPEDFLVGHDLVCVFQVGWTVLHRDVVMYVARRLITILSRLRCEDPETQTGLDALQVEMTRQWRAGTPWRARDALDVIAILDLPAWATLLGLIDECPVLHEAIGASRGSRKREISGSAFEFISENSQVASVREFMRTLPRSLRG